MVIDTSKTIREQVSSGASDIMRFTESLRDANWNASTIIVKYEVHEQVRLRISRAGRLVVREITARFVREYRDAYYEDRNTA